MFMVAAAVDARVLEPYPQESLYRTTRERYGPFSTTNIFLSLALGVKNTYGEG